MKLLLYLEFVLVSLNLAPIFGSLRSIIVIIPALKKKFEFSNEYVLYALC